MILLDTSVLVDSLTGPKRSAKALRLVIESGERILIPTIVLYEWLRGPRLRQELATQEELFPREAAVAFGSREAALAATLYGKVPRPRGRAPEQAQEVRRNPRRRWPRLRGAGPSYWRKAAISKRRRGPTARLRRS